MATENQKRAFEKTLKTTENGEKIKLGKIMVESGYSELTSAKPTQNLINTKGWQELMEEHLPDKELVRVHEEGLNAIKTDRLYVGVGKNKELQLVNEPDFATRHKYLETAYKIKGKYEESPENPNKVTAFMLINNLYAGQSNNLPTKKSDSSENVQDTEQETGDSTIPTELRSE